MTRARPQDAFGQDGVALVGHGARTLLSRAERLLYLPDLRSSQVADLQRDLLQRRRCDGQGPHELGVNVALHHLRRGLRRAQSQCGADVFLHRRVDLRVRPDHARQLPHAHRFPRRPQPRPVAVQLERPQRELVAERGRFGVDAVRSSDAQGVAMLQRPPLHHGQQVFELGQEQVTGLAQLQCQRGIQHVRRRQAEVDPPSGLPDRLRRRLDERRHVVVGHRLQFGHPLRRGSDRSLLDLRHVLRRDVTQAGPRFARQDLDAEPGGQLRLLGPHRGHLRQCVARDHGL